MVDEGVSLVCRWNGDLYRLLLYVGVAHVQTAINAQRIRMRVTVVSVTTLVPAYDVYATN